MELTDDGGTSGFGFATAKAALAEGAKVTIASRSAEKLRSALVRLGNATSGECVDVTDKPELERLTSLVPGMSVVQRALWVVICGGPRRPGVSGFRRVETRPRSRTSTWLSSLQGPP